MNQLIFLGESLPPSALLTALSERGCTVTLTRRIQLESGVGARRDLLLIVCLDGDMTPVRMAQQLHRPGIPWLAWNRTDDQTLTLLAYAAGAVAVLPRALSATMLMQTIAAISGPQRAADPQSRLYGTLQHRYRRGMTIRLEPDTLLDLSRGVVAQSMLHADGTEVLLGLYGPGQLLIGHPDDDCAIQWLAHTDVTATVRGWHATVGDPAFSERLRMRIQLMEAWAAMQARSHLDERLLGLLGLLAEQFGAAHSEGVLIDLRLTHTQLAAAVGATRSTVTRILGDLRIRGLLTTIGDGERERFCLRQWEAGQHMRGIHSIQRPRVPSSVDLPGAESLALLG
jgi:Crp-like helix-turn-helix domain